MVKKRIIRIVSLLLPGMLLLFFGAGCGPKATGPAPQAAEEIKIGCVLSKSGALSTMGTKMIEAAGMAVEEVNKAGGVNGKKIKLYVEDDATDPATALQAVKKLAEVNNVQLMVGGMTSGAAMTCGQYLAERKAILISPSATSPELTGKPWREYVFRTCPSDAFQGRVMAQLALEKGYRKVVVLVMDNTYGVGLGQVAQQTLGNKAQVLAFIKYDPTKMDYRTELTQIKNLKPEAVLHVGYNDDGRVVYRQALELGLENIQWIGCDGVYGTGMFKTKESAIFMEKAMIGTRPAAPEIKAYEDFKKAYEEKYKAAPEVFCDTAYDAVKLLALAIKKAGSEEPQKVKEALKEVGQDYAGASGTLSFDQSNDRATGNYEVWRVVKEGQDYRFSPVKMVSIE